MKRRIMSVFLIAIMVLSFGVFAVGSGCKSSSNSADSSSANSNANSNAGSNSNSNAKSNAIGSRDNPLTVGNTMESNGLKITLNESDLNYTGYDNRYGIHTPQAGMKYVAATFTYQNDGQRDAYVSIYDFKCYADGTACQQEYGLEPDMNLSNQFINTNLSPGRNVTFTTYYSVPEGAGTVELEYDASLWSNKKAYIKL